MLSSRQEEEEELYGPPKPPPISEPPPPEPKKSLAEIMSPCRNVPGMWFIKIGEEGVRILEYEIDIDMETSVKWGLDKNSQ